MMYLDMTISQIFPKMVALTPSIVCGNCFNRKGDMRSSSEGNIVQDRIVIVIRASLK